MCVCVFVSCTHKQHYLVVVFLLDAHNKRVSVVHLLSDVVGNGDDDGDLFLHVLRSPSTLTSVMWSRALSKQLSFIFFQELGDFVVWL